MPTYDYKCNNCEHEFEHFQSMTAKLLRKCPECSKYSLNRLIGSGAGVIFKGSGFYETDYRSENYKTDREKEKDAGKVKKDSKKTDSKKTESKPAEKKKNNKEIEKK